MGRDDERPDRCARGIETVEARGPTRVGSPGASDSADPIERELRAALDGDALAIRALIHRLAPIVQDSVARVLLAHRAKVGTLRAEIPDLTQEVFLALFAREGAILSSWTAQRGSSLRAFVWLVAKRRAISCLRGRRARAFDDIHSDGLDAPSPSRIDPEDLILSRERLELLWEAVARDLGPRGRRMFELLFVEERSVAEIAEETGLGPDAIYAWRSRLRRHVRQRMDELAKAPGPTRRNGDDE